MLAVTVPILLRVIVFGALLVPISCEAKVRELGLIDIGVAVPVNATDCGLLAASSLISRIALRDPAADGVYVTEKVHEAPAASELPQVLV